MNIGEVSFYAGIVLFFIGIIGGGVDIKEVKIPQITGLPRYMCFLGSILFIILGLHLKNAIPVTITKIVDTTISETPKPIAPDTTKPQEPVANKPDTEQKKQQEPPLATTKPANTALQFPDQATAIQDLFAITSSDGKLKNASDKLTSFWFGQSFSNGMDDFYVVFFKTQTLDTDGTPIQSHASNVEISAITYRQTDGQWFIVAKQPQFGSIGAWGEVPKDAKGNPITKAEILQLSPKVTVFMFDTEEGMGGISDRGKSLLAFSKNAWKNIGWIQTGGDNSGNCDDKAPEGKGLPECWNYKSASIKMVAGKNPEYPDLLISYTGTEEGENGRRIPAQDVTYIFDGKEYVNPSAKEAESSQ